MAKHKISMGCMEMGIGSMGKGGEKMNRDRMLFSAIIIILAMVMGNLAWRVVKLEKRNQELEEAVMYNTASISVLTEYIQGLLEEQSGQGKQLQYIAAASRMGWAEAHRFIRTIELGSDAFVMVPAGMVGEKPWTLEARCEKSRVYDPALECRAISAEEGQ